MKNIQNWEKFNESYNQEMINEGLIGDIIKLPFKIVGFLLKPLVPLLLKIIGKTISIENKWKVIKAILDNVVKLALDIEEAKKKLATGKYAFTYVRWCKFKKCFNRFALYLIN